MQFDSLKSFTQDADAVPKKGPVAIVLVLGWLLALLRKRRWTHPLSPKRT